MSHGASSAAHLAARSVTLVLELHHRRLDEMLDRVQFEAELAEHMRSRRS
ncbi:MAG TPA: hypothetical protein VKZ18_22395 [Polyangia bacterium]|nr:hypothetical protein [Polyangia bacterium]